MHIVILDKYIEYIISTAKINNTIKNRYSLFHRLLIKYEVLLCVLKTSPKMANFEQRGSEFDKFIEDEWALLNGSLERSISNLKGVRFTFFSFF